jgi:serine phosphatase RsbU (regulator of sigma subunit)
MVDKNFQVQKVNNSFEILFSRHEEDIIDQLCGEVIGCQHTVDSGQSCGTTAYCHQCELRNSASAAYDQNKHTFKQLLFREFYINNTRLQKHFQYTVKQLNYHNDVYVVMIVDDVTESETKKIELSQKNKEITDSLVYALNIQRTSLPTAEHFHQVFPEHFILFKPKDIVSGDFYWIAEKGNCKFIAVADCTGHGVPGAFMSILGINFLNDIFNNYPLLNVAEILNLLREKVISALKQRGVSGEQKDGMDMVLCSINKNHHELQFAGANNSVFIVSKKNPELLHELKGEKMPIAIHEHMKDFSSKSYPLQKGDQIYLMTDGYQDQFGGHTGKKYYSKNLRNLLLTISKNSVEEQRQILDNTIEHWKTGCSVKHEQTDDITLVGIKI